MTDAPVPSAPDPRGELRRGVLPTMLGWLGTAAGLLAASTMLADGCAINEAQAQRLQHNLPWVGTLVFLLLGLFLARRLSSRKRFFALAAAGTLGAVLLFCLAASLLYEGSVAEIGVAVLRFWPLHLGLLVAILYVSFEARRPGSGAARSARVVAATAVTIAPLEILFWGASGLAVVAPLAAATWALTLLACAVLAFVAVHEGRQVAALSSAPPPGDAPYRQHPAHEHPHLDAHRRARILACYLLFLATLGAGGALLTWLGLPAPKPPSSQGTTGFGTSGC
jgi:hypothetical protein